LVQKGNLDRIAPGFELESGMISPGIVYFIHQNKERHTLPLSGSLASSKGAIGYTLTIDNDKHDMPMSS